MNFKIILDVFSCVLPLVLFYLIKFYFCSFFVVVIFIHNILLSLNYFRMYMMSLGCDKRLCLLTVSLFMIMENIIFIVFKFRYLFNRGLIFKLIIDSSKLTLFVSYTMSMWYTIFDNVTNSIPYVLLYFNLKLHNATLFPPIFATLVSSFRKYLTKKVT